MTREENFLSFLKQNAREVEKPPGILSGVVKSTDESTCSVALVSNDLVLEDVRYHATEDYSEGFRIIPVVGTNCLIGFVGESIDRPYLIACDQVEKVQLKIESQTLEINKEGAVFNNGQNGGMVISSKLADEISAIKEDLNTLKTLFKGWAPASADGGAVLKGLTSSWATSSLQIKAKSYFENEKVKH